MKNTIVLEAGEDIEPHGLVRVGEDGKAYNASLNPSGIAVSFSSVVIVKYQGEKPTGAVQPGTTGRVETAESFEKTIGMRDIPTELRHEQAGRKIKDDEICVKIICAGIE